jgi:hypothetical protein
MIARARLWHLVVVVLVVAALLLQIWIAIKAAGRPPNHSVGTLRGTAVGWRIGRVFSFFTVQSNVLSGLASGALVTNAARDGRGFRILRLNALFGITVTGIVYGTVLAKVHQPHGWQETSSNAVVHYVVPIMMVLGWLMFGPRPRITPGVIGLAMVWPALYLGYALVVGAISKWYPYPFLDVATQGYGRVLLNAVAVLAVFAAASAVFWLGDRRLPPAPAEPR